MSRYERNIADPEFDTARDDALLNIPSKWKALRIELTRAFCGGEAAQKLSERLNNSSNVQNENEHSL